MNYLIKYSFFINIFIYMSIIFNYYKLDENQIKLDSRSIIIEFI